MDAGEACADHINFNPRSREGSDLCIRNNQDLTAAFQSTLPRRERRYKAAKKLKMSISIHAPAKGATHLPRHAVLVRRNFNPRSREGSDNPTF